MIDMEDLDKGDEYFGCQLFFGKRALCLAKMVISDLLP